MKRFILIAGILTAGLMAADFASMTTEELVALRGTVAVEDREAFQAELQSRVQDMTPEERQALMSKAGTGTATQTQTRTRSRAMDALNGDLGTGNMNRGASSAGRGGGQGGHGNGGR